MAGHTIDKLPTGIPIWVLELALALLTTVFSLVISHVGATIVMVGRVVAAGIVVMTQTPVGRREMLIVAVSFGIGLGVEAVPEVLKQFPTLISNLFGHAVTTGGILAIILNVVLPSERSEAVAAKTAEESH